MSSLDLGNRLAKRRNDLKLTYRQAAEAAGISPAYLQKLEQGAVKTPSPHVLHALAEALTIPYSTLMELAGYVVPSGRKSSVIRMAHALSSEDLTDAEAEALTNYLEWYRHERTSR